MIKQLGWMSVAALSLAALSACAGQDKTAPAPTETKAVAPAVVETIHVDPVAEQRLKTIYGNDLATVLGGPAINGTNAQPAMTVAAPAVDESALKAAVHKSGQTVQAPVVQSKTLAIGGGK
jgi:hypothetical protein